jgi:hypothetical protein
MDKEWWRKAKLISVVSSKNYRMVMFHFVSSYCSYDDELIRISPGVASFRRKHCKILIFFKRCLVTFQMMKVIIEIL